MSFLSISDHQPSIQKFPGGAAIKFQISSISRSCRHPERQILERPAVLAYSSAAAVAETKSTFKI